MKNTQFSIKDTLDRTSPAVSPMDFPKILEENVGNFCPTCGKTIFSNLLEIDGKVYLEKNCCTKEFVFLENDVDFFCKYRNNTKITPTVPDAKNYEESMYKKPNHCISVILYYVTARCNQNCPICYQKFCNMINNGMDDLPLEKIKKDLEKYKQKEVYLSGGEPTLRKDLCDIIKAVKNSGNVPGITTNGLMLENKTYLKKLKKAGLKIIFFQFDGFNKEANEKLRGKDYLERKLKILKNIKEVGGIRLLLPCVIGRQLNEEQVNCLIQFALKNKFINKVIFTGLAFLEREHKMTPTRSDLVKILEKENYFNREYFLELVKMYRNIYETTTKLFSKTPLEKLILGKIPTYFDAVLFKKKSGSLQLLFQENDIAKINGVLENALEKKTKVGTFSILLKNSDKLIRSPLFTLFRQTFFFSRKNSPSNKLLQVGLGGRKDFQSRFLDSPKEVIAIGLLGFTGKFVTVS